MIRQHFGKVIHKILQSFVTNDCTGQSVTSVVRRSTGDFVMWETVFNTVRFARSKTLLLL